MPSGRHALPLWLVRCQTKPAPVLLPSLVHIEDRLNILFRLYSVTCRQRKVKCNEERPICGPCAKSSRDCVFSDCIFRHYSASDLAGDETGYATQTWVKVPSDRKLDSCSPLYPLISDKCAFRIIRAFAEISAVVFSQVKDPFADDEEPTFLLEKHRSITATPITPASEQEVIARSAHSSALPTKNGVLTAILVRHFKEGPSQWYFYPIRMPTSE